MVSLQIPSESVEDVAAFLTTSFENALLVKDPVQEGCMSN